MEKKEWQKETINLLVKNELAMENLYLTYAEKFPGLAAFWKEIAEEEKSHAAWIETLYEKIGAGLVDFSQHRFPVEAIQKNILFLEARIKESEEKEISLAEALRNSVHVERGLLENKFFEIFEGDSKEIGAIMEALRLGTEDHLRRVEELYGREGK